MCENFKRIEKSIIEKNLKYIPDNWLGKNDAVVQEELLDYIVMYILKLAFDELMSLSGEKSVSEIEWQSIAKKKIDEYAFWYAEDIFDDLSIFYEFNHLLHHLDSTHYQKCVKIHKVYELYAESIDCESSTFYEKIGEFIDEELKDMDMVD
jgi:GTPase Era involved in 16S rRNA processing